MQLHYREGNDFLTPEYSFNPIFWRFQRAIKNRALNPDVPIPDIKESSKCQFQIHPSFQETAGEYSERLASLLSVRKVIDKGKGKRKYNAMEDIAEPETGMNIDDIIGNAKSSQHGPVYTPALDPQATFRPKLYSSNGAVTAVGLITPVEDFYALLKQPSEEDKVDYAMESMSKAINTFLAQTFKNENFTQVIKCLKALRDVAITEEAALNYNKEMREIKQWCNLSNKASNRHELWEMLKKEKLGLVTNEESEDIDNVNTTKQVADKFWNADEGDEQVLVEKVNNAQISNPDEDTGGFKLSELVSAVDLVQRACAHVIFTHCRTIWRATRTTTKHVP